REFNARFNGRQVTVHAVRKWLIGDAIPTQEKLRILANWLGVSAEWLRFGEGSETPAGDEAEKAIRFDSEYMDLIAEMRHLDDQGRMIAREIIRTLIRMRRP